MVLNFLDSMIALTPKQTFLKDEEGAKKWRAAVDSPFFHSVLTLAMAEFAINEHPSEEKIAGARAYITLLLNFAEIPKEPAQFPQKRLSTIVDSRAEKTKQAPTPATPPTL